jgi:hypothetical protein
MRARAVAGGRPVTNETRRPKKRRGSDDKRKRLGPVSFRALLDVLVMRPEWAKLSQNGRDVLIVLACRAGRDLRCWPSNATIAREAKCSTASVYRAIEELLTPPAWIIAERQHRAATTFSIAPLVRAIAADKSMPEHTRSALEHLLAGAALDSHHENPERTEAARVDSHSENRKPSSILTVQILDSHGDRPNRELLRNSLKAEGCETLDSQSSSSEHAADVPRVLTLEGQPYKPAEESEVIEGIFAYWASSMHKPRVMLDERRRNLIRKRLSEGWTPEQLMTAIAGCAADEWSQGANERGKPFNELGLILRDAEHIERFIELAGNPKRPRSKAERRTAQNVDAAKEFLRRTEPGGTT